MRSGIIAFALSCFCLVYVIGCAPPGDAKVKASDPATLESKCKIYADMSVSQFKELDKYRCELEGEEWSGDLQQHIAWCMQEDNHQLIGEKLIARGGGLIECRTKAEQADHSPIAGKCKRYAREAASQTREAKELRCGFKGKLWGGNYASHYDWCMKGENHSKYADSRTIVRGSDLQLCRKRGGGPAVAANSCAVFDKPQFQGKSTALADGQKVEDLGTKKLDDAISSVRLAKGCHLEAWKQPKFNGPKLVLLKSYESIGSQFDDQISSLACTCGH
jgi:hypothetical protein